MSNSNCRTTSRFRTVAVGLAVFAAWNLTTAQPSMSGLSSEASFLQHASGPIRLISLLFDQSTAKPVRTDDTYFNGVEKNQVRLAVRELWDAFRERDESRMRAITDDEFVSSEGIGKEDWLAFYRDPSYVVKRADVDYLNAQITLDGDHAVATYTAKYAISYQGRGLHVDNRSSDIFIKRNGMWRLLAGGADETRTADQP